MGVGTSISGAKPGNRIDGASGSCGWHCGGKPAAESSENVRAGSVVALRGGEASDWREGIAIETHLDPARARGGGGRVDRGSGDDKDSAGCRRWGALPCGTPGDVFQDAAD